MARIVTPRIEVSHSWSGGIVYRIVGGPENGRTLTLAAYDELVAKGTPIVRLP